MSICSNCRERYMCDRLLYDCPRDESDRPTKTQDELTSEEVKEWERLCRGGNYNENV